MGMITFLMADTLEREMSPPGATRGVLAHILYSSLNFCMSQLLGLANVLARRFQGIHRFRALDGFKRSRIVVQVDRAGTADLRATAMGLAHSGRGSSQTEAIRH